MSSIKLVLTDMDDTVAPHMRHDVSSAVSRAIADVETKGIRVAVVTGRDYTHAKQTLEALGVVGPSVFDGGATVADSQSGEVLWKQWIDNETAQKIMAIIKPGCKAALYDNTYTMVEQEDIAIEKIQAEAPSIFALMKTDEAVESAVAELQAIPGLSINTGKGSHPETHVFSPAIHITHVSADKYHGVEALRAIIGIDKENTLAIGDGNNDVSLFENARVKIAMGNATDTLKAKADHVTLSLEEDGFAIAMCEFVLTEI